MLDPEVASVAFRLPDRFKIQGRMGKWLLRRWLADNLPEAQPFARKRGFTVPVGEWIARRSDSLAPLVARQPGIIELCDPAAVERLFKTRVVGAVVLCAVAQPPYPGPTSRRRRGRSVRRDRGRLVGLVTTKQGRGRAR